MNEDELDYADQIEAERYCKRRTQPNYDGEEEEYEPIFD